MNIIWWLSIISFSRARAISFQLNNRPFKKPLNRSVRTTKWRLIESKFGIQLVTITICGRLDTHAKFQFLSSSLTRFLLEQFLGIPTLCDSRSRCQKQFKFIQISRASPGALFSKNEAKQSRLIYDRVESYATRLTHSREKTYKSQFWFQSFTWTEKNINMDRERAS